MRKAKRYLFTTLFLTLVCFLGVSSGFAQLGEEPIMKPVAEVMVGSSGISWMPKVNYSKLILNISKPDGTIFSKTFAGGTAPYVSLSDLLGNQYTDGSYTYELCVVPSPGNKVRRDDGFPGLARESRVQEALTQTGYFTVQDGMILTPGAIEPKNVISTARDGLSGAKDQLILDDLIVDGSACIGMDCVNGESFGFDTIRLKENNLRIKFQDTSYSASFPSNDWQITANDSANGGANKFSIDDIDSGKTPFTIEAGTRVNALYVDDSGRVGLGTSTPAEDLHIWYGDTPTIRLHQSGSGWAPQTWDIAGNEANFFIRDVTNGSNLPFRIRPGAPTSAIDVSASGNVGIGTDSPASLLEVQKSGSAAEVLVERADTGVQGIITAGGNYVFIGAKSNHDFRLLANDDAKMVVTTSGNVGIDNDSPGQLLVVGAAGTTYCDGTSWATTSSRELKENIRNLTTDEAFEALVGLNPVRFNYKMKKDKERVGFIAEDVPDLVATETRKSLVTMDILAVLTKVVKEQQKMMQQQQKTISELNKRISELEKKSQ
jgi:hypothetical protein